MNLIDSSHESCKVTRRYLDAYVSNELLAETNLDVSRHLETCGDCSNALDTLLHVRNLLRKAVEHEIVPPGLNRKIQNKLREGTIHRERVSFWSRWAMVAAMILLLCVAGWGTYRVWNLYHQSNLSQLTASILKIGLGDHIHCAIDSQFAKQHYTFEKMSQELGPEYAGLVPLVKKRIPPEFEIVAAHRCSFNGRRFVHLVLKNRETVLSLAITKKEGESFPQGGLLAAWSASGVPLYEDQVHGMEVAGFETRDYLAFVVSNLDKKQNLEIASNLAPAVHGFLAKLES